MFFQRVQAKKTSFSAEVYKGPYEVIYILDEVNIEAKVAKIKGKFYMKKIGTGLLVRIARSST